MSDLFWMLVSLIAQTILGVGFAKFVKHVQPTKFTRNLVFTCAIILLASTAFWYTQAWIGGEWLFREKNPDESYGDWLGGVITFNLFLTPIVFSWAISMCIGAVIASCCRIQNGVIFIKENGLIDKIINFADIDQPNICNISWTIGGGPFLLIYLLAIVIIIIIALFILGLIAFIFAGKNPLHLCFDFLKCFNIFNSQNSRWETVKIKKIPIIPIVPVTIYIAYWICTNIPLQRVLNFIKTVGILIGVLAIVIIVIGLLLFGAHLIYRSFVIRRFGQRSKFATNSSSARPKKNKIALNVLPKRENIFDKISKFSRSIGEKFETAWKKIMRQKDDSCPVIYTE